MNEKQDPSLSDEPAYVKSWHGRFALVPELLLMQPEISAWAIRVYACLALYADIDGVCFPSIKTIAEKTGASESTVKRALLELRRHAWVDWSLRRRQDGTQTSSLYRLRMPCPSPPVTSGQSPPVTSGRALAESAGDLPGTRTTSLPRTTSSGSSKNFHREDTRSRGNAKDSRVIEAQRIASVVHEADPKITFPAVMKIAEKMLRVGVAPPVLEAAILTVLRRGKPITNETVRIAVDAHRPRTSEALAPWEVE